ncbi:hypothetical protein BHE74_00029109, partial [Ensete ventricosum]
NLDDDLDCQIEQLRERKLRYCWADLSKRGNRVMIALFRWMRSEERVQKSTPAAAKEQAAAEKNAGEVMAAMAGAIGSSDCDRSTVALEGRRNRGSRCYCKGRLGCGEEAAEEEGCDRDLPFDNGKQQMWIEMTALSFDSKEIAMGDRWLSLEKLTGGCGFT